MTTTEEKQQLGRAKNATLTFLEQRLSVPKIYIDADWDGSHVDVLAIDRDGVGDVHVALLCIRKRFEDQSLNIVDQARNIDELIDRFAGIPAQYKYVAIVDVLRGASAYSEPFGLSSLLLEKSLAPDGIGRIGFLKIEVPFVGDPKVNMEIKPERFRATIAKLADEYVTQHSADWEIRA